MIDENEKTLVGIEYTCSNCGSKISYCAKVERGSESENNYYIDIKKEFSEVKLHKCENDKDNIYGVLNPTRIAFSNDFDFTKINAKIYPKKVDNDEV